MKAHILQYWDSLRASYWFVPTCMAILSAALAFGSLALDEALDRKALSGLTWIYTGGPEGARGVLSAIAGSMITVAGVVFSITMVVLSLTSQQYGPRLLRNFMKNQSTQVVLGTFVATFLFSLLVLRTVRGNDFEEFVPHVSVTIAVALALASIGVLIFFIHHVSVSIQVDHVIASAHLELQATIDRLFPEGIGDDPFEGKTAEGDMESAARGDQDARPLCAPGEGYLQGIDAETIVQLAASSDTTIKLRAAPGDYLLKGERLAEIWPASSVDERLLNKLGQTFVIGAARTTRQDSHYAVRQLVEVALRALSPGINDPFTAISCLDRLAAAMARLAGRRFPSPYRYDEQGRLRVIAQPDNFADIMRSAFVEIRYFGRSNVTVMRHLLEALAVIGGRTKRQDEHDFFRRFAESIRCEALSALKQEDDREIISAAFARCMSAIS